MVLLIWSSDRPAPVAYFAHHLVAQVAVPIAVRLTRPSTIPLYVTTVVAVSRNGQSERDAGPSEAAQLGQADTTSPPYGTPL